MFSGGDNDLVIPRYCLQSEIDGDGSIFKKMTIEYECSRVTVSINDLEATQRICLARR